MSARTRLTAALALLAAGTLALAAAPATAAPRIATANYPVVNKVVGTGTPSSCTEAKLYAAVRTGGNISFNCGPNPITIKLTQTLRTCNTHNCKHVWQGGRPLTTMTLDGGGLVTLSGGSKIGIYYANSCEASFGWLSSRCDLETTLNVTFKNIIFRDGNATKGVPGKASVGGGGGGGAIAMRGNRLTVINSQFRYNRCMTAHSDAGGGAIRVVGMKRTATIRDSIFVGNKCANGGAISSLGAPLNIINTSITLSTATGTGASSGKGGNGGGVYFDGGSQNVYITDSTIRTNKCGAGGSGVFYVSNNRGGTLRITDSTITGNTGEKFWTGSRHDLFYLGKTLTVTGSTID
jgi:hypothetical protein